MSGLTINRERLMSEVREVAVEYIQTLYTLVKEMEKMKSELEDKNIYLKTQIYSSKKIILWKTAIILWKQLCNEKINKELIDLLVQRFDILANGFLEFITDLVSEDLLDENSYIDDCNIVRDSRNTVQEILQLRLLAK